MEKNTKRRGFTLVELMVVILIVGILSAVAGPILRGKINAAKWSEAAAAAGAVRSAVRAEWAKDEATVGAWAAQGVTGVMGTLGFQAGDLTGTYFDDTHFTIDSVDAAGNATISVASPGAAVPGSGQLDAAGGWVYTP